MAEFSEVMRQFQRMCKREDCRTTAGCPMYPSCNISQCRRIAFERPVEFERRVMQWAADHPEPKYPAWRDWLRDLYGNPSMTMTEILESPIDPEIAQRLNIVPRREHVRNKL